LQGQDSQTQRQEGKQRIRHLAVENIIAEGKQGKTQHGHQAS
jgi:hypothetical protein